jgi:CRISPR-associated endonuclease Csn1
MGAFMSNNPFQFSFDLGTNSIGWCVFGLDEQNNPDRFIDLGVRIFSDGR